MNSPVDEIKSRLSIEEVVGSYIELRSFGKTQKALCPFHREKTPSFVVSEERQSFYCFGCNKGGDMFTFVEEFEGVDFKGALKILAAKAGVDISNYKSDPKKTGERDALYDILEEACSIYQAELEVSEDAAAYVKRRGMTEQTIKQFRLGFAPESWSFILDKLTKKGFDPRLIKNAGLVIEKDSGGHYDRFRNRVMFPISDSSGRIIGFSGRTLSDSQDIAKYINSPETDIFKKRDVLFGIDKAKQSIRRLGFSILVEGQMDLVLSHQAGFRNTVATSGTALAENDSSPEGVVTNLELARRLSKNIVIAFDSDAAGKKASIKNAQIAFGLGMDVKIANLPLGKDPADVILSSKESWKDVIRDSKDVIEFQLDEIELSSKSKKDVLKRVRDEVFESIKAIPSSIEREHYLNLTAEKLGMRSQTVIDEFLTLSAEHERVRKDTGRKESSSKREGSRKPEEQEMLYLASLLSIKGTENVEEGEFTDLFGVRPDEILATLKVSEREKILFEAEAKRDGIKNLDAEIQNLLKRFKIKKLEDEALRLLNKIRSAESEAEKQKAQELLKSYSQITKEIENLKETK